MKEARMELYLPVYNYLIKVVVSEDIVLSRIAMDSIFGEKYTLGPAMGIHSTIEESSTSYIFLPPTADVNTIVHECFHCVVAVMSAIGSFLDESSEEVYAYTLGYITEKVSEHVKRSKKQFNKKK